jgi:hypothetical protein
VCFIDDNQAVGSHKSRVDRPEPFAYPVAPEQQPAPDLVYGPSHDGVPVGALQPKPRPIYPSAHPGDIKYRRIVTPDRQPIPNESANGSRLRVAKGSLNLPSFFVSLVDDETTVHDKENPATRMLTPQSAQEDSDIEHSCLPQTGGNVYEFRPPLLQRPLQ